MNDTVRSALTGGLGVVSLLALIALLIATELLTFFRGRVTGRVRVALLGVGAALLTLVVAQMIVRIS